MSWSCSPTLLAMSLPFSYLFLRSSYHLLPHSLRSTIMESDSRVVYHLTECSRSVQQKHISPCHLNLNSHVFSHITCYYFTYFSRPLSVSFILCFFPFPSITLCNTPVLSCPVLSCLFLSCPVLSCCDLSCPVLSCLFLSCPVLSCHVMSCHVMSCLVLSLSISLFLSITHRFAYVLPTISPSSL